MTKPIIEVAIDNYDEFELLMKKAQRLSAELSKVYSDIRMFQAEVSFPTFEEKQH
ncbi:unnamed protein product [Fructobacillus evanidus]|uniref:Uncharacterized protein n=1 Tax=Fructobacillus evanidus TaxID=3064281 RepID=A0ABM9N1S4_9LACO|nr:unnamed protein product [Fructobacillus sp. LMG 32999]CAK1243645.1 unnamed protein product [Fructobacillus sp. LMG 32999]CAK1254195.1 unnamed protein product [Fructobacillus sp. LMG 32999]CAK1254690.1 unnamed protein product [Fructobacillus sp. LMG 32999]